MISKFTTTNSVYSNDIFGEFEYEFYWKEGLNYEVLVHNLTEEKKQELIKLYTWVEDYQPNQGE